MTDIYKKIADDRLQYVSSATIMRDALGVVERHARRYGDTDLHRIATDALAKADALEAIEDFDASKIGPALASVR